MRQLDRRHTRAREGNELYRLIAESSTDLLSEHTLGGVFLYASPASRCLLGYEPEELVGRSFLELVHPDDRERVRRARSEAPEEGNFRVLSYRVRRKDGSCAWLETTCQVVRDDGQVRGFIAVSRDVTERRLAEEKLREAEARYRALVEQVPAVVYTGEPNESGATTYVSPQIEALLGYAPEEFVADPGLWTSIIHPEDRARVTAEVRRTNASGEPFGVEHRVVARDGRTVWVQDEAVLVRDGEGRPLFWQGVKLDVTGRKRAEEELRRSDRRIAGILENITDAFFTLDRGWRFTYVNREAERILQRGREVLLGKNIWEEFPRAASMGLYRKYRRALTSGLPVTFEEHYQPPGGWYEIRAYPTDDGLAVYFQDVTERKRAEERLRESEERFRRAFESAAVGMALIRPDESLLDVNQPLCEILGYTEEELRGTTFREITHPEDREADAAYRRRLLEGEIHAYQMEKRYLCKDGEVVWGLLSVSLVRDADDRPLYFIGQVQDITESRRAEEALKKSEQEYRRLFELANDAIVVYEPDGRRILDVNQNACELYGYDKPKLVGMTMKEISLDRQRARRYLEALLAAGSYRNFETVHRRSDGSPVDVLVNSSVIELDGRRAILSINRDITARKRAEASLVEIREAERRRIARDLHDAVLQDLSGALQGLQAARVESPEAGLEAETEALRKAVAGLRGAIYDLRLEKEQPFLRSVESLVELNLQLNPDRVFSLSVEEGFPAELPGAAGTELPRIIQEALVNARRHSSAGRVEISLSRDGEAEGKAVRVEVTDDGRGFCSATTRWGMGVSGMRERADALGGTLEVKSEPGKGTAVVARVPLS